MTTKAPETRLNLIDKAAFFGNPGAVLFQKSFQQIFFSNWNFLTKLRIEPWKWRPNETNQLLLWSKWTKALLKLLLLSRCNALRKIFASSLQSRIWSSTGIWKSGGVFILGKKYTFKIFHPFQRALQRASRLRRRHDIQNVSRRREHFRFSQLRNTVFNKCNSRNLFESRYSFLSGTIWIARTRNRHFWNAENLRVEMQLPASDGSQLGYSLQVL